MILCQIFILKYIILDYIRMYLLIFVNKNEQFYYFLKFIYFFIFLIVHVRDILLTVYLMCVITKHLAMVQCVVMIISKELLD